jgi:cytoskeleton protein RodZ
LGIKELANTTKIQERYLEALEAENWAEVPAGVTGRGFVRVVAQEVGLSAGEILARYREARGSEEVTAPHPLPKADWDVEIGEHRRTRPALFGFLFLLGSAVGVWLWSPWTMQTRPSGEPAAEVKGEPQTQQTQPWGLAPEPAGGASPAGGGEKEQTGGAASPAGSAPAPATKAAQEVQAAPATPAVETAAAAQPPPSQPPAEGTPGVLRLEIQAVERAWVRVVGDGGAAQERILGPGERVGFDASRGFEVKLGNAGGVRLFWNGEPLKVPGRPGQVATLSLPEALESLKP